MDSFGKYITRKLPLAGLVSAVFIIYPNIACIPWELSSLQKSEYPGLIIYFTYRFLFFWGLISLLIKYNLKKLPAASFQKRLTRNFLILLVVYLFFASVSYTVASRGIRTDFLGSTLIFQFFVTCFICTFVGYVSMLYNKQIEKEQEIEQLKTENLQSRYDALMNQINPHFFFNSLNGLTALIRKKNDENTLTYVGKMSDVFRYILQSDKKGLVTLEEELAFVYAFRYMMEVRFANKLEFNIDVDPDLMSYKLPVLSVLPLIENVAVHNMIDSEHKMAVTIRLNEEKELVVSNSVYPKLLPPETNGTGLQNLKNRFLLLMNKKIRIENSENIFCVYLPLT
jgi:sensor histidine kinase YesM